VSLCPQNIPNRWMIVRGLFDTVSCMSAPQRKAFMDFACPDAGIRKEVEGLLEGDMISNDMVMPADAAAIAVEHEEPLPEISGYTIDSVLGSGGAGSVYSATNSSTGRRVAIKMVRSHGAGSQVLQRFRQECRALSRLSHSGIVQVVETGSVNGNTYLVMEFISGMSLDMWTQAHSPTPARSIVLIQEILAALAHAHDAGVIHRDIKPHNVMVTADGHIKLVDFGVARLTNEEGRRTGFRTETGHLVGTFAYMSPEQTDGRSDRIGVTSDVYQVALLLYEMLAGRLPYEADGKSAAGLLKAVLMDERVRLEEVRPELAGPISDLLSKALSIAPSARPQTVRAFDEALDTVLATLAIV
jgi:serine/threonine protein kinase